MASVAGPAHRVEQKTHHDELKADAKPLASSVDAPDCTAHGRGPAVSTGQLCDVHAERGIVGCALQGAISDDLQIEWIRDDRRKVLFLAADTLRAHGEWHIPQTDHPSHMLAAAMANAERVAHAVTHCRVWPSDEDPRAELTRCMQAANLLALLPYYVSRVKARFHRLDEITGSERHLQQLVAEVA